MAKTPEDKLKALKKDVEGQTGEKVETKTDKSGAKQKAAKKKVEKEEKVKLSKVVEDLGIEGLDTKTARKILRKGKKEGDGKQTWSWAPEEVESIKDHLKTSFEDAKQAKADAKKIREDERAAKKEAAEAEAEKKKTAKKDEEE